MVQMRPLQVIFALMLRERQTRYAGGRMGSAWALVTPVAWIAFVVLLFEIAGRQPAIDVHPAIFVTTGVLPYIAFRQAVTSMARAYPSHRYLRFIRPVGLNQILLATIMVEALNMLLAAIVIFGVITLVFGARLPSDPLVLTMGFALAWFLAAGIGRFVAVLSIFSDSAARATPILLRPLFWVSGVFYTATELPAALQSILWYSPLLHVTEIIRTGYFSVYKSPISDMWFPLGVACAFYLASVVIEPPLRMRRNARFQI